MTPTAIEKAAEAVQNESDTVAPEGRQRARHETDIVVATRLPHRLRRRLQALADERATTPASLVRTLIEAALDRGAPALVRDARATRRAHKVAVFLSTEDVARLKAYAARKGLARDAALAEVVSLGIETAEARDGIPASRADALQDVLQTLEALLSNIGPAAFGTLVLLAYWVSKASAGKIAEDELLEQARAAGEDEWARVRDELRRGPGGEA